MLHAENTVSALKKWDISKRTHDVVFDWRECPKPEVAGCLQFRRLNIQGDSSVSEAILADANFRTILVEIRVREGNLKSIAIGDDLDVTEYTV